MPTIKKYIIKPDNVKNPFQMRATSPAKKVALTGDGTSKDYSHLLQSNMSSITYNKPKLDTNTKTGDGLLGPIEGGAVITEIGKDANQQSVDDLKKVTTKKENVRTPGLTRRIDKASNPAKIERLKGKRERKQLRQDTREGLIKQRNVEKLENRTGERMQERTDRFRTRRGADVVQERQAAIGSSMGEVNKMQANVSSMSLGNRFKEKSKSLNATAKKTNQINVKSSALGLDNLQQREIKPMATKEQRWESRGIKQNKRNTKLANQALDIQQGHAEGDIDKYKNKLNKKGVSVTALKMNSPLNVRKKFRKSSGADKSQYKIYKSERAADSIAKVGKMKSDVSKLKLDTSSKLGNATSYKPSFGAKPTSESSISTGNKISKIETSSDNNVSDNKFTKNLVRVSNISSTFPITRPETYASAPRGNNGKTGNTATEAQMRDIRGNSASTIARTLISKYNQNPTPKSTFIRVPPGDNIGDNLYKTFGPRSPIKYSIANPFSPNQQGVIGQVYNPSGNDISQFEQGQAFNKFASNPNTLNEPPIPTEAQTTMNDLQMENEPMGAFGDDLTGAMNNNVGLPPEQGMGSTRGFVPQLSRKERRQQRRSDRRDARREQGTGLRNFITRAVTGGMLGYNGPGNEDRQYRRTGIRPFGG